VRAAEFGGVVTSLSRRRMVLAMVACGAMNPNDCGEVAVT